MSAKSLKAEYSKLLLALVLADVLFVCLFLIPGFPFGASFAELARSRLLATVLVPVVVLLLVHVLNNETKCMLVYWRRYGWLPGCEAFTKHVYADVRIDVPLLRKNVGEFPTEPREQNARWYRLYKMVEDEAEIRDPQRDFLMYRDMAALSLAIAGIAPFVLYHAGATPEAQWLAAAIFVGQYLLTAISAKHRGIRFVKSVLALHSVRKIQVRPPRG
jgi:hypothetical protein